MNEDDDERYEPLDPSQGWDEELASDLIGATLFIGITHYDSQGTLLSREQVYGRVSSVRQGAGIKIIQTDGQPYVIAPILEAIEATGTDSYQLSDADELVDCPDYVAWVDVTRPPIN